MVLPFTFCGSALCAIDINTIGEHMADSISNINKPRQAPVGTLDSVTPQNQRIAPPIHYAQPQQQTQQDQVPTDRVPLPSNGIVYPPNSSVCNADAVEIRSMTAREEDILTSRALLKSGKAITTLLANCIVDKSIVPGSLLAGGL